jgi:acyl carrier protein
LPGPSSTDHRAPLTQGAVLDDVRTMIADVIGEDYVVATDIELATSFYEDLEIESIEFVALGEALQERYGDRIDFAAWIATLELDEIIGMTVGRLVDEIVGSAP